MSSLRTLPFVKASAYGNDFIMMRAPQEGADLESITRSICNRNTGVGADGVEWLYETTNSNIRAHLLNSDGSYAEVSGNGTRCVAVWYINEFGGNKVRVETGAGVKVCDLISQCGPTFKFSTGMGTPTVTQPFNLKLKSGEIRGLFVSMGNPHFVTFVNSFPANWQVIGEQVQAEKEHFPNSTNVEFVRVISADEIEIRIFERGAGETQSSGTGSSASAVASIASGRAHNTVLVTAPGGSQKVNWDGKELTLDGEASLICSGNYYL